jgi:hypothetical protein
VEGVGERENAGKNTSQRQFVEQATPFELWHAAITQQGEEMQGEGPMATCGTFWYSFCA